MREALSKLFLLAGVVVGIWVGPCPQALAREPADLGGISIPSLSSPGCQAIPYRALPVYHRPAGRLAGQLVLDHPEWADTSAESCDRRPSIQLDMDGHAAIPLLTREIAYEHTVPAVFARQAHAGVWWYQIRDEQGREAWLPAPSSSPWRYLSLEADLVQGLARLPETCTQQGRCTPTTAKLQALVEQAGGERPGCGGNAYDMVGPVAVLPDGRRAYRVRLAPELMAAWGRRLPNHALVPTYDRQDRWTGQFFARGC